MNKQPKLSNLKEITAYKKKLNWGDVPAIYHLAATSLSEIEGILTHGFDSTFKHILNKNMWNLTYLEGAMDKNGVITVKHKPKIKLQHVYTESNYELHCIPMFNDEELRAPLNNHPNCPFEYWSPESMQLLFRANNLSSFIRFTYTTGDTADLALINYGHAIIENHIEYLRESFDILEIKGRSVAKLCQHLFKHCDKFSDEEYQLYSPSFNIL